MLELIVKQAVRRRLWKGSISICCEFLAKKLKMFSTMHIRSICTLIFLRKYVDTYFQKVFISSKATVSICTNSVADSYLSLHSLQLPWDAAGEEQKIMHVNTGMNGPPSSVGITLLCPWIETWVDAMDFLPCVKGQGVLWSHCHQTKPECACPMGWCSIKFGNWARIQTCSKTTKKA